MSLQCLYYFLNGVKSSAIACIIDAEGLAKVQEAVLWCFGAALLEEGSVVGGGQALCFHLGQINF